MTVTITWLEMTNANQLRPARRTSADLMIVENSIKQWRFNRFMYSWVGEDWQWQDKLLWSQSQWQAYVENPHMHTYVAYHMGSPAGYFELSHVNEAVEIAIFGLTPEFIGQGFGGVMLSHALHTAWAFFPDRVWLHTCSLDHPKALDNYKARGMSVYKVETQ